MVIYVTKQDLFLCFVFVPVAGAKYPDKDNFKGERMYLSYSSRLQSIIAETPRCQELQLSNPHTAERQWNLHMCVQSSYSSSAVVQDLNIHMSCTEL